MRIGMMLDSYKPYVSGITNYVDINKRHLEMAGHEVFVFTFGDLDFKDAEPGVIRSRGVPLSDSGFYLSMRYSRAAKKLLQSMDIVHVHHPFLSGRLALRYCHPLNIPVAYTNHTRYDLYAHSYLPLMPDNVSLGLLQSYMPSFCKAMDLVITPSQGMEKVLRELNVEGHIEVVPNGVDLKKFSNAHPHSRADFGYSEKDILLIYAGRVAHEKNLPFLLQSFAGIAQALPNVYLLVVGGGTHQLEEEIHSLVGSMELTKRVMLTGQISYDQLPKYLAMCDIFVTSSISEVHPLSVIEAMGTGLPIMGIQSVGVGDIVQDGVTGFLATNDQASFTAKLTRLCLDQALRARMSTSARKASSKYAIERTTKLILKQYEKLATEPPTGKRNWSNRLRKILENSKS